MKKRIGLVVMCMLILCPQVLRAEATRITVTAWGDDFTQDVHARLVEAFNASQSDIQAEYVRSPGNYWDRLAVFIASGIGPDVYFTQEMFTVEMVAQGWFIPLNDYIDKTPELARETFVADSIFEPFTWNGKIGAIPTTVHTSVVYYNKALFNEAALPYPDGWDWSDLVDLARKLTVTVDNQVVQYGYRMDAFHLNYVFHYLWQNGGGVLSEDRRTSLVGSPETVGAFEFLRDLIWEYKVAPGAPFWGHYLLENQNLAMYNYGSWMLGSYLGVDGLDFDVVPPAKGKVETNMLYPNGYGISSASKNPDAAWEFIKFAAGPEGQAILTDIGIPVRTFALDAYLEGPVQRRGVVEAVLSAQAPRVVPGMERNIIATINNSMDAVWRTDGIPVGNLLTRISERIQLYLDEEVWGVR